MPKVPRRSLRKNIWQADKNNHEFQKGIKKKKVGALQKSVIYIPNFIVTCETEVP